MKFSELPIHHALLITGTDRTGFADNLWQELSRISHAHRYFNKTVLDIETAREIISWAQAPYHGERIALISFHTAGLPAQNAMLKVLEEPREGTRFVLVTTHKSNLIDTILSRVRHIIHATEESKDNGYADEFLATEPPLRTKLPHVVELLARVDEEGRKDREAVKEFILSLVEAERESGTHQRFIAETIECASYAADPSASGKALLEYLALLLPQVK